MIKTPFVQHVLLIFWLVTLNCFATVDGGEEANFVGFVGSEQQYALIKVSELEWDNEAKLILVDMRTGAIEKQGVVMPEIEEETFYTQEQLWRYFQAKSGDKAYDIFLPEANATALPYKDNNISMEEYYYQTPVYSFVAPDQKILTVSMRTLYRFDAAKYYDVKHRVYCQDCSACSKRTLRFAHLATELFSCENRDGILTQDTIVEQPNDRDRLKKGATCNCHDNGYIIALKMTYEGASLLGEPLILLPEHLTRTPETSEAYRFTPPDPSGDDAYAFGVSAYINKNNHIIIIGHLAHTPRLNGTYWPIWGVFPAPSVSKNQSKKLLFNHPPAPQKKYPVISPE